MPGKRGRPKINIPPKIWDKYFNLIATTNKSHKTICKELNLDKMTVWSRINSDKDLLGRYTRAKEQQSEMLIEDINEIDTQCIEDIKGKKYDNKTKNALVQAYRLQTDNRKWIASKLLPSKYGDKLGLMGPDGKDLTINFNVPKKEEKK